MLSSLESYVLCFPQACSFRLVMKFLSSFDHVVVRIWCLQRRPRIISFWITAEVTSVSLESLYLRASVF